MIDASSSNCYNNCMRFAKNSSKIALAGLVVTGMFMSSCGAWDWLTGKQPKWKREQAKQNAEAVANLNQTLSKIDIKNLPKKERQCYEVASQLSGVPLPVMYAITLNETGFYRHDVFANDGLEGKNWDCGIMQSNSLATICPLANRLAHHLLAYDYNGHIGDKKYSQLLAEIEALGLKYIGGGSSGGWCNNLTHAETVEYCRELDLSPERIGMKGRHYIIEHYGPPLTPDPVCLGIFLGAYELSYDMWHLQHDSYLHRKLIRKMIKDGAYEDALQNAGQSYLNWVLVSYMYNGVIGCSGLQCYFDKFARHLHGILTGVINIGKKYF